MFTPQFLLILLQTQRDAVFHRTAFDYSRAELDGFRDHQDMLHDKIYLI